MNDGIPADLATAIGLGGEMGARFRRYAWDAHPLGPPDAPLPVCEVLRTGEPLLVPDTEELDGRFRAAVADSRADVRSAMYFPLRDPAGATSGAIALLWPEPHGFGAEAAALAGHDHRLGHRHRPLVGRLLGRQPRPARPGPDPDPRPERPRRHRARQARHAHHDAPRPPRPLRRPDDATPRSGTMTPAVYALHTEGAPDDPPDARTITVTGELDATNAAAFDDEVGTAADSGRPVVLDISAVRFIDSAGFAALHRLEHRHRVAVVVGPHSHLRRSAMLMGLPFLDDAGSARSVLEARPR